MIIRNSAPLGPCSRNVHRALWCSQGGGRFLMSKVPLYGRTLWRLPSIPLALDLHLNLHTSINLLILVVANCYKKWTVQVIGEQMCRKFRCAKTTTLLLWRCTWSFILTHRVCVSVDILGPLWEGFRESRKCSRDTYPESYITQYTGKQRLYLPGGGPSGSIQGSGSPLFRGKAPF